MDEYLANYKNPRKKIILFLIGTTFKCRVSLLRIRIYEQLACSETSKEPRLHLYFKDWFLCNDSIHSGDTVCVLTSYFKQFKDPYLVKLVLNVKISLKNTSLLKTKRMSWHKKNHNSQKRMPQSDMTISGKTARPYCQACSINRLFWFRFSIN